jgi:hypothetical protein
MAVNKNTPIKPKLTNAERHELFVEMAKKVEASEETTVFDRAFDRLSVSTRERQRSSKTLQR